jgi:hypothetical protein
MEQFCVVVSGQSLGPRVRKNATTSAYETGIMKSLFLAGVVGLLVVTGCSTEAPSPVTEEAPLIGDIVSMVQDSNGTFTVTCRGGRVERGVTTAQIAAQQVCNNGSSVPGGTCVEGTSWECTDAKERWTGSLCCVQGNVQCTDGTSFECTESGEHWTGRKCCVENHPTCVEGTSWECTDDKEHWTGSKCCVEQTSETSCVDGSSWECNGPGEHWTGKKCCVDQNATCTAGTSWECTDDSEHWTGTQCCVDNQPSCVDGSSWECTGSGMHWTGRKCCVDR